MPVTVTTFEGVRAHSTSDDKTRYPIVIERLDGRKITIAYRNPKVRNQFTVSGLTFKDGRPVILEGKYFNLSVIVEMARHGRIPGILASDLLRDTFDYEIGGQREHLLNPVRSYRITSTQKLVKSIRVHPRTFEPWSKSAARLANLEETKERFLSVRKEAGIHKVTDVGEAVEKAKVLIQHGFVVGLESTEAIRILRETPETQNATLGFFVNNQNLPEAIQAVKNGVDILFGTEALLPATIEAIQSVSKEVMIFSQIQLPVPESKTVVEVTIAQVLRSGAHGVILKPYRNLPSKIPNISQALLKEIAEKNPNVLIGVAAGVFEGQVADVLALPKNVIPFLGFKPGTPQEINAQAIGYNRIIQLPTAARLAVEAPEVVEPPLYLAVVVPPKDRADHRAHGARIAHFVSAVSPNKGRVREFSSPVTAAGARFDGGQPASLIVEESSLGQENVPQILRVLSQVNQEHLKAFQVLVNYVVWKKVTMAELGERQNLSSRERSQIREAEQKWIQELRQILSQIQLPRTVEIILTQNEFGLQIRNGLDIVTSDVVASGLSGALLNAVKSQEGKPEKKKEESVKTFGRYLADTISIIGSLTGNVDLEQLTTSLAGQSSLWQALYGIDTSKIMATLKEVSAAKERRGILVSWNAFQNNQESITGEIEEFHGGLINATLVVKRSREIPDKEAFLKQYPAVAASFGNRIIITDSGNLSDLQLEYNKLAQAIGIGMQFVLVANEGEFKADDKVRNDKEQKALLLVLRSTDKFAYGVIKAAAILLFFDRFDTSELPTFIVKIGNIYIYIPAVKSIEWAIWVTAVKEALKSIGSAA